MVYIGFVHHWAPIIFGILSYCSNSIFVYIVMKKTRSSFGAYKYMLMSFGIFDIAYSTVDMVVAMGSHIHFIYRYIALCKPRWISIFNETKWIIALISGVIGQGFLWFCSVYFCMWSDDEMRSYLAVPFRRDYNADVYKIPLLGSTYWGASFKLILRTSAAIVIITIISCFTISFCIWTGYTIFKTLNTVEMSKNTKRMHRNLLGALAIQTFIPFAISYLPCVVAWSVPIIHVDTKSLNNFTAIIAVAAFPFIDPLAIMMLVPDYRNAFFRIFIPCLYNPTRTYPESTVGESSGRA
uniref:G_PROTEIN_RECEP_F1_2 domain-containing protein n=1 Tax=Caenorhabditis tropicalis TaxID=1561998 RepID=A0A1I7TP47_9PELO